MFLSIVMLITPEQAKLNTLRRKELWIFRRDLIAY